MALFFVAVLAFAGVTVTASKGAAASKHLTMATTLVQKNQTGTGQERRLRPGGCT